MKTSETLNAAADLIEERGWSNNSGGWGGDASNLCLEGGLAAATGVELSALSHKKALAECSAYRAVWEYLQNDQRWGFRQVLLANGHARPYDWNDVTGREAHEVIEVLRAAAVIEASRERESVEAP